MTGGKGTNLRAPRGGGVSKEDKTSRFREDQRIKTEGEGRTNRRAPRGGHSEEWEGCCPGMTLAALGHA